MTPATKPRPRRPSNPWKGLLLLAAALIFAASPTPAHAKQTLLEEAQFLFDAIPDHAPDMPENPVTAPKVQLGRMLFFDPRLSKSQLISCNTCHNLALGGVDHQETSVGHEWQTGPRNAPTVLNAVFNIAQFWDGRARDLAEQAGGPMQNPIEMASSDPYICQVLHSIPEYVDRFQQAFPGEKDPVCFRNARDAIEAFEATLITPDSRFDRYLKGDTSALSEEEKQGLTLFIRKGCAKCHMSLNIGGNGYYEFGVVEKPGAEFLPPRDKGRLTVMETVDKAYVFKAPSLRNVALTAPYFHSGKAWSLKQAVDVMASSQLGISFNDKDTDAVTAFLKTLTGRQPEVVYPVLPPSTAQTPLPAP